MTTSQDLIQIRIPLPDLIRDAKRTRKWRRLCRRFASFVCGRLTKHSQFSETLGYCVCGGGLCDPWVEMAGGMDVHKNVHIENWGTARENLEKTFRFNRRNITLALIFGVAVPFLTYQGITGEFHKQDADAGQPPRKFLGTE